jgi:3-phytase
MTRRMLPRFALLILAVSVAACVRPLHPADGAGVGRRVVAVRAVPAFAETAPVATDGDAADDPAIWVNAGDPAQSLVVATDKQRGLHLYDLAGRELQVLPDGRLNNVDLRDGFALEGRRAVLVAASNRSDNTIAFYTLDPQARRLTRLGAGVATGFREPYGLCLYASRDGAHYVFVNDAGSGRVRQWRVRADGARLATDLVREFVVGSQAEGCAADDDTGDLYVAEEDVALWRYRADPDGGSGRRLVDRVGGPTGLAADLEGVAIWCGPGGRGFIVVSNQGANNYAVYRREGDNDFVGLFEVVADAARGVDGTAETDGLDVTSHALGDGLPDGLLVVQDGRNEPPGLRQNFKLVSWSDVAAALDQEAGD